MDIDETLLSSQERELDYPCSFKLGRFFVYLRPGVQQFFPSVIEDYSVGFWSSGSPDYVAPLVEIFADILGLKPVFAWDSTRCIQRTDFVNQDTYYLKDLKKLKRAGFSLSRILIVEDEPRKVWRNYGNALYVKPFNGEKDDNELQSLRKYLHKIKDPTSGHWRSASGARLSKPGTEYAAAFKP